MFYAFMLNVEPSLAKHAKFLLSGLNFDRKLNFIFIIFCFIETFWFCVEMRCALCINVALGLNARRIIL